jgi:AcrR family transcriptional regulator
MTQPSRIVPETRPRGRPRSERARSAILTAAADLILDEGGLAASMDAVAERAGVSKATIYRWWPSKEMLVLDALLDLFGGGAPDADTGSLHEDLLALVLHFVHQVEGRQLGRVIAALAAEAQSNPDFAEAYHTHYIGHRRKPVRAALERAIERGAAPAALDVDAAIDLIYGPLHHRLLHGHAPLSEEFARTIVEFAVAAIELDARPAAPA